MTKNMPKSASKSYIPPITGYYIGYRPNLDQMMNSEQAILKLESAGNANNEFVFKTVKAASSSSTSSSSPEHHHISDTETFVLNNLKRATRYDIKYEIKICD